MFFSPQWLFWEACTLSILYLLIYFVSCELLLGTNKVFFFFLSCTFLLPVFPQIKGNHFLWTGPSQSTPLSTPVATVTPRTRSDKNLSIALLISGGILAITVCVFVIFYKCRQEKSSLDTERRCFIDQTGGNGEEKVTYQSNNVTDHLTDREDNVNQDPIKSFIKNPIGGSRSPSTSCKIREPKKDNVNKLKAPL